MATVIITPDERTPQERALEPIRAEINISQVIVITSIVAMSIFGAVTVGGVALAFASESLLLSSAYLITSMIALELFVESYLIYQAINPLKNRLVKLLEDMEEVGRNVNTFFEDLGNLNVFQILNRAVNNVVQDGFLGYANRIRGMEQEHEDLIVNRALIRKINELSRYVFVFPALVDMIGLPEML